MENDVFKKKFSIRDEIEFLPQDFYNDICVNHTFPETEDDVKVRTIKVQQSLLKNTARWSQNGDKNICHLVVSHGALIDFMAEIYESNGHTT